MFEAAARLAPHAERCQNVCMTENTTTFMKKNSPPAILPVARKSSVSLSCYKVSLLTLTNHDYR